MMNFYLFNLRFYMNPNVVNAYTHINNIPSDTFESYMNTPPNDLFNAVIHCFGISNIRQLYNCCMVSRSWKLTIERDYDRIFQQAKIVLELSNDAEPAKLSVFNSIPNLKEIASRKTALIQNCPKDEENRYKFDINDRYDWFSEKERQVLIDIFYGLESNLLLVNVGESTWDIINQYASYLAELSHFKNAIHFHSPRLESVYSFELRQLLMKTAATAAEHSRLDDAFTILEKTEKVDLERNLGNTLFHFCVNNRVEQAKQIFLFSRARTVAPVSIVEDEYVIFTKEIYKLCESLKKIDICNARLIASEFLPLIENDIKAVLDDPNDDDIMEALELLTCVFNCYILLDDSAKVSDYLSKYRKLELEQQILKLAETSEEDKSLKPETAQFLKEYPRKMRLMASAKTGNENLKVLIERVDCQYDYYNKNLDKKKILFLNSIVEGFGANLCLLSDGTDNWEDVKKYVPVLTGISLKSVFLQHSDYYLEALHLVLGAALDRHLYEYALSIYEETPWTDTLRCHVMQSFLRYSCRNYMFAQAKEFCSLHGLSEFDLIRALFDTLIVLNQNNQSDIAKLIASQSLPSLDKREMKLLASKVNFQDKQALETLSMLFSIYLQNNEVKKIEEFLSTNSEAKNSMLAYLNQYLPHWSKKDQNMISSFGTKGVVKYTKGKCNAMNALKSFLETQTS